MTNHGNKFATVAEFQEYAGSTSNLLSTLVHRVSCLENELARIREATCSPVGPVDLSQVALEDLCIEVQRRLIARGVGENPYYYRDEQGRWAVTRFGSPVIGHGRTMIEAVQQFTLCYSPGQSDPAQRSKPAASVPKLHRLDA